MIFMLCHTLGERLVPVFLSFRTSSNTVGLIYMCFSTAQRPWLDFHVVSHGDCGTALRNTQFRQAPQVTHPNQLISERHQLNWHARDTVPLSCLANFWANHSGWSILIRCCPSAFLLAYLFYIQITSHLSTNCNAAGGQPLETKKNVI